MMSLGSLSSFITSLVSPVAPHTAPAVATAVSTLSAGDLGGAVHAVGSTLSSAGADISESSLLHGGVLNPLAPQAGPALNTAVMAVVSGNLSGLGHALDSVVSGAGSDIAGSTILHGVAHSVADLSATGISNILSPVAMALNLPTVTSSVDSIIHAPLTGLGPTFGPATSTLLASIGAGSVSAIGHATDSIVTAAGTDISQSTILHGAAAAVTSVFSVSNDSFHFSASNVGGSDALSGIGSPVANAATHSTEAVGATPSAHMDVGHVETVSVPNPLADLAHAVHHA